MRSYLHSVRWGRPPLAACEPATNGFGVLSMTCRQAATVLFVIVLELWETRRFEGVVSEAYAVRDPVEIAGLLL